MQGLKCSSYLVDKKLPSHILIVLQVVFADYALIYGYSVTFRKKLDQPESFMMYTFMYDKICTTEVFSKSMRMPLRYACNNYYVLKTNRKFAMDKEYFKEVTKDIHYVNINPPVFHMTYYDNKAGNGF